ncbi:MAG: hypothetical protein ABI398_07445 [Devosia sp.]
MSLPGPEVLRALDEAIRDIRREEDEIAKRSSRGAELLIKLHAQQASVYRQLGRRLEPALRDAQAKSITEVTNTIGSAIARYDAAFADAEARLQQIEAEIARANADRTALQTEAARRDGELNSLTAKARPTLGNNAEYAARLATARELAAMAAAAADKARLADAEHQRNSQPYRDDPLFTYLRDRAYGTARYAPRGMTGWFDAQLAAFTDYGRAQVNFALINELPARLRQHAEALQEQARAADAGVAALENVAVDTAGGRSAREAIETMVGQIDALDKKNVVLQDRRDEAIQSRSDLAQGHDAGLTAALAGLQALLSRDDLRTLLRQARTTPGEQDLSIAQQFDDLAQRVKDSADEAREYRSRLEILMVRRRDLEDIQYEIKLRGLDNPQSRFAEDGLADSELNDLLRGETPADLYWRRLRGSQSWAAPGYGGPGGGWGRRTSSPSGTGLSRPRGTPPAGGLTSAA